MKFGAITNENSTLSHRAFLVFFASSIAVAPGLAQDGGVIVDPDADVSFRPDIWVDNRGSTVVDITAPENGVSLNRYDVFNVGPSNLVFNNSTSAGNSVVAGQLRANPNLIVDGADIIVNEVTSTQGTFLRGQIEVFGRMADVIIANPNGVVCGGCSFINTNTATLTTGVPLIDGSGGILLNIGGGSVSIEGQGLDGTGVEAVNLVGRSVRIDGRVATGGRLTVSGGAQRFDPKIGEAIASIVSGGGGGYAVDGTELGVMTAGQITVVGNEAGLGVRLLGAVQGEDDVEIVSAGDLFVRSIESGADILIHADGNIEIDRTIAARDSLTVASEANNIWIDVNGGLYAGDGILAEAAGDISFAGKVQSGGDVTVDAGRDFDSSAAIAAAGMVTARAVGNSVVSAGRVSSSELDVTAGGEAGVGDAYVSTSGDVRVAGNIISLGAEAVFDADRIVLDSSGDFVNGANLNGYDGRLDLSIVQNFTNLETGAFVWEAIDLDIAGVLTNHGLIYSDTSAELSAFSLYNEESGVIFSRGLMVSASEGIENSGQIVTDGDGHFIANSQLLNRGDITAATLAFGGADFNNGASGRVQSVDGSITLGLTGNVRNDGLVASSAELLISVEEGIRNSGQIASSSDLTFLATEFMNSSTGQVFAETILANLGKLQNDGLLSGSESLAISAGEFENDGDIHGQTILVSSEGDLNSSGRIDAAGHLSLSASSIDLAGVTRGGFVELVAGNARLGGQLLSEEDLQAQVSNMLLVDGITAFGGDGEVISGNLRVSEFGLIRAGEDNPGNLRLVVSGQIENAGALYAGNLLISADIYEADAGAGLIAVEEADLTFREIYDNGQVQAREISIWGGLVNLNSDGGWFAEQGLAVSSSEQLFVSGVIQAHTLNLSGGLIQVGATGIVAGASLVDIVAVGDVEVGGRIQSDEALSFRGDHIAITELGGVAAGQTLEMDADILAISGLLSAPNIQLDLGGFRSTAAAQILGSNIDAHVTQTISNSGLMRAESRMRLSGGSLANHAGGVLVADTAELSLGGGLLNEGGIYGREISLDIATDLGGETALSMLSGSELMSLTTLEIDLGNGAAEIGGEISSGDTLSVRGEEWRATGTSHVLVNNLAVFNIMDAFEQNGRMTAGQLDLSASTLVISGDISVMEEARLIIEEGSQIEGTLVTGGLLELQSSSLNLSGTVQSYGKIDAQLSGDVSNSGNLLGYADVGLAVEGELILAENGLVAALASADVGGDQQSGSLDLVVAGQVESDGTIFGGTVGIIAAGYQGGTHSTLASGAGGLSGSFGSGQMRTEGIISSNEFLALQAGDLDLLETSLLKTGENISLQIDNHAQIDGQFIGYGNAAIETRSLTTGSSAVIALISETSEAGHLEIGASESLVHAGKIYAGTAATSAGQFATIDGSLIATEHNLSLTSLRPISLAGILYSGSDLTLNGDLDLAETSHIEALGRLDYAYADDLTVRGRLQADTLILNVGNLVSDPGSLIYATNHLSLTSAGNVGIGGVVSASDHATFSGQTMTVSDGGRIETGHGVDILLSGQLNLGQGGVIIAGQDAAMASDMLAISASALVSDAESIIWSHRDINLVLSGQAEIGGSIRAENRLNVSAGNLYLYTDGSILAVGSELNPAMSSGVVSTAGVNSEMSNVALSMIIQGAFEVDGAVQGNGISLQSGTLRVGAGGDLSSSTSLSVELVAGALIDGAILSGGALALNAGEALTISESGALQSNGALLAEVDGSLSNAGALSGAMISFEAHDLTVSNGATIYSASDMLLNLEGVYQSAGIIGTAGDIQLSASEFTNIVQGVDVDGTPAGGVVSAHGNVTVTVTNSGDFFSEGYIGAGGSMNVTADEISLGAGSVTRSGSGGGQMIITAHDLILSAEGLIYSEAGAVIEIEDTLSQSGAIVQSQTGVMGSTADNSIAITASDLVQTRDGTLSSSGGLYLNVDNTVSLAGETVSAGVLDVSAGVLQLAARSVGSSGSVYGGRIRAGTQNLNLMGDEASSVDGHIVAGEIVASFRDVELGESGQIAASGDLALSFRNAAIRGLIAGGVNEASNSSLLRLSGRSVALGDGGRIQSEDQLNLNILEALDVSGVVTAEGSAEVRASSLTVSDVGVLGILNDEAAGALSVDVVGSLSNSGTISAGSIGIHADNLVNNGGATIFARADLQIATDLELMNSGAIAAGGGLNVIATQIHNGAGALLQGDTLSLRSTTDNASIVGFQNLGDVLAYGDMQITANRFVNGSASSGDGARIAAGIDNAAGRTGEMILNVAADAVNAGSMFSSGSTRITTGSWNQVGNSTLSASDIVLSSDGVISLSGLTYSEGDLSLTSGVNATHLGVDVIGRVAAVGAASIHSDGQIRANSTAELIASFLELDGSEIDNQADLTVAGDLTINANSFSNSGHLSVNNLTTLNASTVANNAVGKIDAFNLLFGVEGGGFNNVGAVNIGQHLLFNAGGASSLENSGVIRVAETTLIQAERFENSGLLQSEVINYSAHSSAQTTFSNTGALTARDNAIIDLTNRILSNAGVIEASGEVQINAAGFWNSQNARLASGTDIVLMLNQSTQNYLNTTESNAGDGGAYTIDLTGIEFDFCDVGNENGQGPGPDCGPSASFGVITLPFGTDQSNDALPSIASVASSIAGGGGVAPSSGDFINAGLIEAGGTIVASATRLINGGQVSADDASINLTGYFDNIAGGVRVEDSFNLTTRRLVGAGFDGIASNRNFRLEVLEGDLIFAEDFSVTGDLVLIAAGDIVANANIGAFNNMFLSAGDDVLSEAHAILAGGSIDIIAGDQVQNNGGVIQSGDDVFVDTGTLFNIAGSIIQSADVLSVVASGNVNNFGTLQGGVVSINATNIRNGMIGHNAGFSNSTSLNVPAHSSSAFSPVQASGIGGGGAGVVDGISVTPVSLSASQDLLLLTEDYALESNAPSLDTPIPILQSLVPDPVIGGGGLVEPAVSFDKVVPVSEDYSLDGDVERISAWDPIEVVVAESSGVETILSNSLTLGVDDLSIELLTPPFDPILDQGAAPVSGVNPIFGALSEGGVVVSRPVREVEKIDSGVKILRPVSEVLGTDPDIANFTSPLFAGDSVIPEPFAYDPVGDASQNELDRILSVGGAVRTDEETLINDVRDITAALTDSSTYADLAELLASQSVAIEPGRISGDDIYLTASGDITNSGSIAATRRLAMEADNILNRAGLGAGGGHIVADMLYMKALGDISNLGGVVSGNTLASLLAGGDILNTDALITSDDLVQLLASGSIINSSRGGMDIDGFVASEISSGGELYADAGGDLLNLGGRIAAANNFVATISGDIINEAAAVSFSIDEDHGCRGRACGGQTTDYVAAELSSGATMLLEAGGDINNIASNIGGFDSVWLNAGGDINNIALTSVFTIVDIKKSNGLFGVNKKSHFEEAGFIRSGIIQSAIGDLLVDAGRDIVSEGSIFSSGGVTRLDAERDILLSATTEEIKSKFKKSGFSGFSIGSTKSKWNDHVVAITQVTGGDVELFSGGDIRGEAANVSAFDTFVIDAVGSITFDAEKLDYYHKESGWSVGLSFPGSALVEAAMAGGSFEDMANQYLQSNPFFGSLYALSESETGAEVAFNGVNALTRGADFFAGDLTAQLNPLAGLSLPGGNDGLAMTGGIATSLTINISTYQNESNWTESIASELISDGNLYVTSGQDINLIGGTQTFVSGDAVLSAVGDIILAAAEDTRRERSSSFGGTFGLSAGAKGTGVTVGLNGSNGSVDATTYTQGMLSVGGNLSLDSGGDTIISGARIGAGSADLNIGGDLMVETLQNLYESDNSSWGGSVTVGPTLGGSLNVASSETDRQFADDIAGIFTSGALSIDVAGNTELTGSTIASDSGELSLTTDTLTVRDLEDFDRSESMSLSISGSQSDQPSDTLNPILDSITDIGGSYAESTLEGVTRATIGEGSVIVRSQSDEETEDQLADINRNIDDAQIITRDDQFATGNLSLNVGAARRFEQNAREIGDIIKELQDPTDTEGQKRVADQLTESLAGIELTEQEKAEIQEAIEVALDEARDAATGAIDNAAALAILKESDLPFLSGYAEKLELDLENAQYGLALLKRALSDAKVMRVVYVTSMRNRHARFDALVEKMLTHVAPKSREQAERELRRFLENSKLREMRENLEVANAVTDETLAAWNDAFIGDMKDLKQLVKDGFIESEAFIKIAAQWADDMPIGGDKIANNLGLAVGVSQALLGEAEGVADLVIFYFEASLTDEGAAKLAAAGDGAMRLAKMAWENPGEATGKAYTAAEKVAIAELTKLEAQYVAAIASGNNYEAGKIKGLIMGYAIAAFLPTKAAKGGAVVDGLGDIAEKLKKSADDKGAPDLPDTPDRRTGSGGDGAGGTRTTGTCSFRGDMLVPTTNGLIEIQNIRAGIQVQSRNPETGEIGYKPVVAQYANRYPDSVYLMVKSVGGESTQTIVSNRIHPYFVQVPEASEVPASSEGHLYDGPLSNGYWVDADDLVPGYRLLNEDASWSVVVSVEVRAQPLEAYNLTIADWHTYFIGADLSSALDAVWVHNDCYDLTVGGQPVRVDTRHSHSELGLDLDSERLPPFTGAKSEGGAGTFGYVEIDGKRVELTSNNGQPGKSLADDPGLRMDGRSWTHVEGHAAALLRKMDGDELVVTINNPAGPCPACRNNLHKAIPSGKVLRIRYPDPKRPNEYIPAAPIVGTG